MSEDVPASESGGPNWITATFVIGLAELILFGFFAAALAVGLKESVSGSPHRLREALLVAGEVSVAAAISMGVWAGRKDASALVVAAMVRGIASIVTLAYPFASVWYDLLNPAREQLSPLLVFGLGIAQTVTVVLAGTRARADWKRAQAQAAEQDDEE